MTLLASHGCGGLGSLQIVLDIVGIAKDVLRGVVAKRSVCDGVDNRAHLVLGVLLCQHQSQNNDNGQRKQEKRGGWQ